MPIIKDVEIYWAKLDPKRPVPKYLKPTVKEWSLEIRTYDKAVSEQWKSEFHLRPKFLEAADGGKPYYRAKLQKMAIANTKDPEAKIGEPVEVVGPKLEAINPNTVGNGSIGDVMVHFRNWTFENKPGISADLRKVRIKKLVEYYREFEDFDELDEELEIIGTVTDTVKGEKAPSKGKSKTEEEEDEIYD